MAVILVVLCFGFALVGFPLIRFDVWFGLVWFAVCLLFEFWLDLNGLGGISSVIL